MARNSSASAGKVDFADTAAALAKAVREGDIVNFRLLFLPLSPARESSTESFDMPKYAYLLPDEEMERDPAFQKCLEMVQQPEVKEHILQELSANRPAQLPSGLLLELADNGVRFAKYTAAAQAYEMLRIRSRIQREFFEQADAALDKGDVATGVRGYIIATGLAYDYAAFPEPKPVTPDYQTRALLMHAEYPQNPHAVIGMWDTQPLLRAGLAYLLLDTEAAARLDKRPLDVLVQFLAMLVRSKDPKWDGFIERYKQTEDMVRDFANRFADKQRKAELSDEIANQLGEDPRHIPAALLGRTIEPGEWWQYLKELACEHPAGALFVARQMVGDAEILVPRHNPESPVAKALGL